MNNYRKIKFEIKSREESANIQRLLFKLGYAWPGTFDKYPYRDRKPQIDNTEAPFLYALENGEIRAGLIGSYETRKKSFDADTSVLGWFDGNALCISR